MKKKIVLILLIIITIIPLFLFIIPTIIINKKIEGVNHNNTLGKKIISKTKRVYSFADGIEINSILREYNKYNVEIENENGIIYNQNAKIKIKIDNTIDISNIYIVINDKEYKINSYSQEILIKVPEGKNNFKITMYDNKEKVKELTQDIYYIEGYKKQFAEELSSNGVFVHYINGTREKYEVSFPLLKLLGNQYVRADFVTGDISKYNWVNELSKNSKIKILAMFYYPEKINSERQIDDYINLIDNRLQKFSNIKDIEIMNEANFKYLTKEDIAWYSKIVNKLEENNKNYSLNIMSTGTNNNGTKNTNTFIASEYFYQNLNETEGTKYLNSYAFHPYSFSGLVELKSKIKSHVDLFNSFGGFNRINVTEYGTNNTDEKEKSSINVKQTVVLEKDIDIKILYNFWDTNTEGFERFGLITHDYLPKKSYYAMKNYYQNTNGAEYIGQVNIANGIEAHVYDKDGKPKIIAWATDTNKPVTIDYLGFKASDLYGKEIENTNGKLEITTSPVYIDNVSTKNFYQAISNSITTGYKEFDEKFANEINKVPELKTKISNLNTFAESLKNVNTLDENIANSKMKEHFSLGNTIIKAYDDGRLDIEYVKLSSILDYLNTIGNAYEDLITVSAKTRITDLTSITNEVNEAKSIIENDTDIDIVYPNKIYKFSKDLLDTSSYVLGLDEENDIKTGLINSKATHAKYLADWSEEFSKIYIKGWLQGKVNSIKDENSKVYSKNEQLKSNTKISTKYNSLIENLNNLPSQTTSITKDTINSIYNQQYELINTIVEEFNNKKINISESEYQTLVTELLNISEQYKELFNTYITEDDIQNSTIENNINNVIDRYNENKDIDMTMCAELINNIKEIYNDKIQTEETSYNYLNKRRIQNTCTIISKMLENKIKETAQQEAQKIGIAYNIDPSTLTNKDVIAQIKLPNSKSSIENNPNNEKYTFTENETKNITINIRGYKYNYNIKVTNIDKTPPQITGIEQDGKYKESITPQITDENLSEVKLIKDGQEVENYKQNTAITQEGIYQLKATDKAGNETSINFVIAYPEDEKYKIENNTIKNIKGETSVETLKGKLQVDEKYTIKRKDTEIQNSDNIATGDILETESGNKYTLIVRGDLNKDGKVDIKDLVKMRKFLLLGNNLDESEEMAADTNLDGKEISIKDLVKMRIILLTQ